MFHQQMKHLEVCQNYSAAHHIFNSLLSVSSGDETLRLMLDIFLQNQARARMLDFQKVSHVPRDQHARTFATKGLFSLR